MILCSGCKSILCLIMFYEASVVVLKLEVWEYNNLFFIKLLGENGLDDL